MPQCANCPKIAVFEIGDENARFRFCLDCYIAYQNVVIRQHEMYERVINYFSDQIDHSIGLPPIGPRFPERSHIVHMEGATLNNINVSNSQIGVLNTGAVRTIDSSLTVLRNHTDQDLASFVKTLTECVVSSDDLTNNQKNEILEILGSLTQEAIVPPGERKSAVARALLMRLKGILDGISALNEIWSKVERAFYNCF